MRSRPLTIVDLSGFDPRQPRGPHAFAAALLEGLRGLRGDLPLVVLEPGASRMRSGWDRTRLLLDGSGSPKRRERTVLAVYDLAHLYSPKAYRVDQLIRRSLAVAWAVRQADQLIATSEAIREGLLTYLNVAEGRVTLVPPAIPGAVRRSSRKAAEQVRNQLGLPPRYLLFVGTLGRRKNIELLLAAWRLAQESVGPGVELVIAGARGRDGGRQAVAAITACPRARWVGYVPAHLLWPLLSGAVAWLCPAPHDGCAVGALEAMACGTPPVVARWTAGSEVVAEAGLVLDPGDARDWADAVALLTLTPELRGRLSRQGLARAALFSPEAAARPLLPLLDSPT